MVRGRILLGALMAGVTLLGASSARGEVDLGGTPVHTEQDTFVGAGFEAEVHSFVYAGSDAVLPDDPLFAPLGDNESLIIYFMINTGETGDIDLLGLLNPAGINPSAIGISSLTPDGWLVENRENPVFFEGSVDLVQYQWDEGFSELLSPGEWSVMFYRLTGFWQPVDGFVGLGSDLATNLIPGPGVIPEPATLSLLLIGAAAAARRSRR